MELLKSLIYNDKYGFNSRAAKTNRSVETMNFQELNNDQRREVVNSQQRFQALRDAKEAYDTHRGSLTWVESKGREYLVRSYYDKAGLRKQAWARVHPKLKR